MPEANDELLKEMKALNRSPYEFIKNAYHEIRQTNYIKARHWLLYATLFSPFFEDPRERANFEAINSMAMDFLLLYQNIKKGGKHDGRRFKRFADMESKSRSNPGR